METNIPPGFLPEAATGHKDPELAKQNNLIARSIIEAISHLYSARQELMVLKAAYCNSASITLINTGRQAPWFDSELQQIGFAIDACRVLLDKVTNSGLAFPLS